MELIGNKLTPTDGMHLKRISDGTVAEGVIYIPSSLSVDDFIEVTHEEYLRIIQSNVEIIDTATEHLKKLEEKININSTEITNLQEAMCEVYESII